MLHHLFLPSDISLDFVTGLPPSKGNTTILTVVDKFSKMVHFIPLVKLPSAKEMAEIVLMCSGCMDFPSAVHIPVLGGTVSMSSGYHSQTNGQSERLNQELETGLRCLASRNPSHWSEQIIWLEDAHNTLPSSSTGLTPFQCVYQPPLFPALEREVGVPSAQTLLRRWHGPKLDSWLATRPYTL